MKTLKLKSGYSRAGDETTDYRAMTAIEAQKLQYGERIPVRDNNGNVKDCKVNGKPKTWKRSPFRVRVPLKYGMYEYLQAEADGDANSPVEVVDGPGNILLVVV